MNYQMCCWVRDEVFKALKSLFEFSLPKTPAEGDDE